MKTINLLEGIDVSGGTKTIVKGFKKDGVNYITEIKREMVKKTLSDKIKNTIDKQNTFVMVDDYLLIGDVKEALKKFIEEICPSFDKPAITKKALEFFGKKLVQRERGVEPYFSVLGTWKCSKSSYDYCCYDHDKDPAHDFCVYCGEPEERQ